MPNLKYFFNNALFEIQSFHRVVKAALPFNCFLIKILAILGLGHLHQMIVMSLAFWYLSITLIASTFLKFFVEIDIQFSFYYFWDSGISDFFQFNFRLIPSTY